MAERSQKRAPARTPEARQNQMISAAMDLAEKQILEGTASAAVVTHFLKLGTAERKLEIRKLESEAALAEAKAKQIDSAGVNEEKYERVIRAIKGYSGQEPDFEDGSDDY